MFLWLLLLLHMKALIYKHMSILFRIILIFIHQFYIIYWNIKFSKYFLRQLCKKRFYCNKNKWLKLGLVVKLIYRQFMKLYSFTSVSNLTNYSFVRYKKKKMNNLCIELATLNHHFEKKKKRDVHRNIIKLLYSRYY